MKSATPVAWMRRWHFEGENPQKQRNENGRMVWPVKYKFLAVTPNKIFPDDVPLFAHEESEAQNRLFDVLRGDDGQAWKEAERYLERERPDLYAALNQHTE